MNFKNTTSINALKAMFMLIWKLLKEQKIFLISFLVFMIICAIIPLFIYNSIYVNDSWNWKENEGGLFTLVSWLPSISITLAVIPMVHQQIFSSSILKRMKASGINSLTYLIVMVGVFSIVATLTFWILSILTQGLYSIYYDKYTFDFNWISFIFLSPIIWVSFSTTGVLIGNLKINEIFKGIFIFIFIILVIFMSFTLISFSEQGTLFKEKMKIFFFFINPWSMMINLVNSSIIDSKSYLTFIWNILIIVLFTFTLFMISIHFIGLSK